jgi:hypothetical protein
MSFSSRIPEIGAGIVTPDGLARVERRSKSGNVVYLWALGKPYPLNECRLQGSGRLSDWFGHCPSCGLPASDYVPRQRIGKDSHGGYSFCEPCLTTWTPEFKKEGFTPKRRS